MFVRITWSKVPTQRMDAAAKNYREKIHPSLQTQAGFLGGIVLADRGAGEGIVASYWQTAEAMAASETMAAAGREQATQVIGGELEVTDVDRFEIILQDRSAPVQVGTFVRATDLRSSAAQIDATLAFMREKTIPVLKGQPGYRALLMMANRESGRLLVSSVWNTAAEREASDAAISGLRKQASELAQAQSVRVSLYESLVAEVSPAAQAATATAGAA
jgi:heme-degrading monooxygenase HmoA